MQNYELLELVQRELQRSGYDIKAELQLLQAADKGLKPDDFMISCNQLFRRGYSRDIVSADIVDDRNQNVVELHLSRSGIYDHLPEGLFFQQVSRGNRPVTVADMTMDYKENKKREEEIRRFFLPFEHDFFLQRMNVEAEENELLLGMQSGMLNDYFYRFWNLPDAVPPEFIGQFILLLPYAYMIAGNFELTAQCLQLLLNEDIKIIRKTALTCEAAQLAPPPVLGEALLGLDMVCGNQFWEGDPSVEVQIGPLLYSKVADYLEGGNRHILMETFNRFFMPAGLHITISVQLPVEKMNMTLLDEDAPVLGYSSFLT